MAEDATFIYGLGPMTQVMDQLSRVAPLDTTVLLLGETGTGKELAARYLLEHHPGRRGGPLVSVHCGAIPDSLLESELFGHVRGAFTGADRDRIGQFERAHGGTLFLDEISTMTLAAQVRLLRVLQERRVTRLGCGTPREVDVRVVVATNQNLERLVDQGEFRADLFYRVSVFPILLPPLRDRRGDIAALAECFTQQVAERLGLGVAKQFSPESILALTSYDWPGNVRELENAVEFASIQCGAAEVVQKYHLPPHLAGVASSVPAEVVLTKEGLSFRTAVTNLERQLILQSLRLSGGNKARAAELLDLKRTTFLEKLRRVSDDEALPIGYAERSSAKDFRECEA